MKNFFKSHKFKVILLIISFLLITFASTYILYAVSLLNGIENNIRLILAIILVLIWLCATVGYKNAIKKKKAKKTLIFVITLIYSLILILIGYYINKTYNTLKGMTTSTTSYSTSLVSLKGNKASDLDSISDGEIGMLSDSTSIVGNTLPLEIMEKNKINNKVLEYDSFIELIAALLDKEVEYAFLPTNYVIMFSEVEGANFENINEETKIIYTENKKIKNVQNNSNKKLTEPFTILLMGVDSELEDIANASFNGDSLMLITFNPTTLNTTILSIPRDTYVPITCFSGKRKNKITHAAWYGETCMIDTIENYTGITIDYYAKINFKGVVKLVDTLGGVEVDVPYAFCEQNSNREWGKNTVYVEQGLQTLNGEQALAFARNRHSWPQYCSKKYTDYISNDFIRGQHQQMVVTALLNKLKEVRNLNTVTELLDTISNSMETNMTTNDILSLYNIGKDILAKASNSEVSELVSMQRLYLNGKDAYIYDQSMGLDLYNYVVYEESLNAVVEAMKINLELQEPELIKDFSFNIDKAYEATVIGKNVVGKTSVSKLPDFTGDTESQARSTCSKLGINVSFKYVTTGSGTNNTVISQNYKSGYDISYVNSLVLTILKKEEKKETTTNNKVTNTTNNNKETNTTNKETATTNKKENTESTESTDKKTEDEKESTSSDSVKEDTSITETEKKDSDISSENDASEKTEVDEIIETVE